MKTEWVPRFKLKLNQCEVGRRYLFQWISDDGGVFESVREYDTILAYDLRVLCVEGEPLEIPE